MSHPTRPRRSPKTWLCSVTFPRPACSCGCRLACRSTRDAASPAETGASLDFKLDSEVETRAAAEVLRPVIDNPRFTLLRRLGAGGMGVVFEAYDEDRGEMVALKTMRRVDPAGLVRFKQEFRTLCDLTHRNLVNLYQLFAVDQCWFFTMELVDGIDFLEYLRRGDAQRQCSGDLGPSINACALDTGVMGETQLSWHVPCRL